mgnify:CR=1 FL=1
MSELFVYSSDSEEETNYELLSKSENNNIETEIEGAQTSNLNNMIFNKLDQKNQPKSKQEISTSCKKIIRNW